jgi:hypothetical protein
MMTKVKETFGIIILIGALIVSAATSASAQSGGGTLYQNGCVIREWENERNPQYRESNPSRCQALDRNLDGGDGPNQGRVRGDFQPSPRRVIQQGGRK